MMLWGFFLLIIVLYYLFKNDDFFNTRNKTARDILDARLASGEISIEEYKKLKENIS